MNFSMMLLPCNLVLLTLYVARTTAHFKSTREYVEEYLEDQALERELNEDSGEPSGSDKRFIKYIMNGQDGGLSQMDLFNNKETLNTERELIFENSEEEESGSFAFCFEHLCQYERPVVPGYTLDVGVSPFSNYHHKPSVEEVKKHLRVIKRKRAAYREKNTKKIFRFN